MSTLKTGKVKTTTIADELDTESTAVTNVINGSAKAWVNFNGIGTVAIRRGFNVSSITDNGTGNYTVNFTTAMVDADYCFQGSSINVSTSTASFVVQAHTIAGVTTSSVRIINSYGTSGSTGVGARDTEILNVAIFS
jgi:hypothetical protein